MIRLDCTRVSIVIVCTDCPYWRAMRFTKHEAWKCAADHEKRTHPGLTQAQNAFTKHRAREGHAV
ncbi:hypothetical protein [Microbacterium sp.]|uniref:hypothetical protein n=1 Tax=Microbacterium sp. TaxID=51671 RepID=UPI0028118C23|nr:hypothetical protein [Microbacterium sp.]